MRSDWVHCVFSRSKAKRIVLQLPAFKIGRIGQLAVFWRERCYFRLHDNVASRTMRMKTRNHDSGQPPLYDIVHRQIHLDVGRGYNRRGLSHALHPNSSEQSFYKKI